VVKAVAIITGVVIFVLTWLLAVAASLAVPALAVWALGHFALGWW
jgi:hypothetical protein